MIACGLATAGAAGAAAGTAVRDCKYANRSSFVMRPSIPVPLMDNNSSRETFSCSAMVRTNGEKKISPALRGISIVAAALFGCGTAAAAATTAGAAAGTAAAGAPREGEECTTTLPPSPV